MAHPNYDEFWKKEAWVNQLHASPVPNLNVAGFWDQEDPWGPWQIFRHAAEQDPDHTDFMVAGPWYHGEWQTPKGDSIGLIAFGGHETAREFREEIEAPFFRYYLHGVRREAGLAGNDVRVRLEHVAHLSRVAAKGGTLTNLYLHADGTLSFVAPTARRLARTASTSPIRRTPSPIARARSRRHIRLAIGAPGRSPTSGSWITGPMC